MSKHGFEVLESKGPVYRETAQLSMRHGTVYDAAYVGLYEHRTHKRLYTVDGELIEKNFKSTTHQSLQRTRDRYR